MTAPMTDAEVREALARAERATPGPWYSDCMYSGPKGRRFGVSNGDPQWRGVLPEHDAEFCVSARTDVPRLAADLLAARAERDEFQKRLVDVEVGKETIDAVNRAETAERERDEARARESVVGKASQEAVVRALLGLSPTHNLGTIFPDDVSRARGMADAILAALGGHG